MIRKQSEKKAQEGMEATRIRALLGCTLLGSMLTACTHAPPQPAATFAPATSERKCERPVYPMASRLAGEQGVVRLRFHIDPNGDALRAEVVRSSGYSRLDYAAMNALMRCEFKPGFKDGLPVESELELDYTWKLVD